MKLAPGAAVFLAISLSFSQPFRERSMLRFVLAHALFNDPRLTSQQKQESKQATEAQQKIRVNSDLVVLSVMVKDGRGNLVSGLRQEDFQILDDKVEQTTSVFSEEGLPLSLVVLIDSDLKWREGSEMVKSLRAVVAGLSTRDVASLCRFDLLFYPGEDFTADTDKLLAELKNVQAKAEPPRPILPEPLVCGNSTTGPPCIAAPTSLGARPSKALDDAIFSAAELVEKQGADRRKMILVVSDGANEPKLNHHSYENVMEVLLRENISVFGAAVGSDSAKRKYARLLRYSSESGGELFYGSKSGTIEHLYSRITEEARHSYTLAYVPGGNNRASSYHTLQVRMTRDALRAETREGYYTTRSQGSPEN